MNSWSEDWHNTFYQKNVYVLVTHRRETIVTLIGLFVVPDI